MKKLIIILGILGVLATWQSCDKVDPSCEEIKSSSSLITDFPDSIKANTAYSLPIDYVVDNSCGNFKEFEVIQEEYNFKVKLKTVYKGCQCDLEFEEKQVDFIMNLSSGNYTFQFWVDENDYDQYDLEVYE